MHPSLNFFRKRNRTPRNWQKSSNPWCYSRPIPTSLNPRVPSPQLDSGPVEPVRHPSCPDLVLPVGHHPHHPSPVDRVLHLPPSTPEALVGCMACIGQLLRVHTTLCRGLDPCTPVVRLHHSGPILRWHNCFVR